MRRLMAGVLLGAASLGVVAGCSNSMTKDEFAKELSNELSAQGLDPALGTCIADELAAKGFEFRKFGELTATEQEQVTEATTTCVTEGLTGE